MEYLCHKLPLIYRHVPVCRNHNLVVTILTRRVPLVEQELLPFRSTRVHPRFLVGFVLLDLQFYVYALPDLCLSFCTFFFTIVLSVLYRFMASDYFGILKLFFNVNQYLISRRQYHCLFQPSDSTLWALSTFSNQISNEENIDSCLCRVFSEWIMKHEEYVCRDCLKCDLKVCCFSNSNIFVCLLLFYTPRQV